MLVVCFGCISHLTEMICIFGCRWNSSPEQLPHIIYAMSTHQRTRCQPVDTPNIARRSLEAVTSLRKSLLFQLTSPHKHTKQCLSRQTAMWCEICWTFRRPRNVDSSIRSITFSAIVMVIEYTQLISFSYKNCTMEYIFIRLHRNRLAADWNN